MRSWTSHTILAVVAVVALLLLAAHATIPLLYTAANTSTAAHVDPATVPGELDKDAATLIPLMNDLLGQTAPLTLNIKLKDYASAERDLARYARLSGQFDELVINLDVSGTDIGEFQQVNRENLDALTALLNDTQRLEGLQKLEIQILDDEGWRASAIYEGVVLEQKMQEGFFAYAGREDTTARVAEHYGVNTTPYRDSVRNFAEIVDAAEDHPVGGGDSTPSPLGIAVTPARGRYGDTLLVAGAYSGGITDTPIEVYVDSRIAGDAALDENGSYSCTYRIDRIPAGLHLAYATADAIYSTVTAFEVLPGDTTTTLRIAEDRTTVCIGTLMAGDRPVSGAPIILRVDGTPLSEIETGEDGTYREELTLSAGEHTVRAEFNAAGYPLKASESQTETVIVRSKGLSPIPFVAAFAMAIGSGWYLRRRRIPEAAPPALKPREQVSAGTEEEIAATTLPPVDIEGLPPREAATILFCALRARLGIPVTMTPRDCAQSAPAYARFFERYESIRYAGEIPSEEDLQAMQEDAIGGGTDA